MGYWMDYEICFANRESNLAEEMIAKGLAQRVEGEEGSLKLHLKEIDSSLFKKGYNDDGIYEIIISNQNNGLFYCNKWCPDDRLVTAISKKFPEDVFEVRRIFDTPDYASLIWYEKNGEDVLKNGTPVKKVLVELNPNLLREKGNGAYKISLPIGEEGDLWGTIVLPKENVTYFKNTNNLKYNIALLFTTEEVTVSFKNKSVRMKTEDMISAYYESRHNYREKMMADIEITGLSSHNFVRRENNMGSYYIVKIPCLNSISNDGYISITLPDYYVNPVMGSAVIGPQGKSRNARITTQEGETVTKVLTNPYIKECYDEFVQTRRNEQADLEPIAEIEM